MMETPNIFTILDRYIDDLFAPEDEGLTAALKEARKAGLPEIQISAGQGKFLYLLAKMVGARRIPYRRDAPINFRPLEAQSFFFPDSSLFPAITIEFL
jgi:hypothetical protein